MRLQGGSAKPIARTAQTQKQPATATPPAAAATGTAISISIAPFSPRDCAIRRRIVSSSVFSGRSTPFKRLHWTPSNSKACSWKHPEFHESPAEAAPPAQLRTLRLRLRLLPPLLFVASPSVHLANLSPMAHANTCDPCLPLRAMNRGLSCRHASSGCPLRSPKPRLILRATRRLHVQLLAQTVARCQPASLLQRLPPQPMAATRRAGLRTARINSLPCRRAGFRVPHHRCSCRGHFALSSSVPLACPCRLTPCTSLLLPCLQIHWTATLAHQLNSRSMGRRFCLSRCPLENNSF